MINLVKIFLLVTAFFLLASCEKSLNTSADFRERYVLTSIIDCNKNEQFAFITKTYDHSITGINPNGETVFVKGADVKMWYDYNVYALKDTVLENPNLKEKNRYAINGLNPDGDRFIEIEALLPNNLLLSSITKIPPAQNIAIEETNIDELSKSHVNSLNMRWKNIGNYIYEPKLVVQYYSHIDSTTGIVEKVIPLDILIGQNETTFVFPQPSNISNISYEKSAVDYIFRELSKNDPNKSNYVIIGLELQIRVYDENLTAYYSSTNQFLDQFSISLDSQLYSNIDGGLGIFGSFITRKIFLKLDENYVKKFGYSDAD